VNLGFPEQVPSLLAGRVDALEGYGYFYGNLADKVDLLPWSEHGLDYYSEGIFVNTDFLAENEGVVRRFLRAFIKGFQYELDNPDEAAKLLAQGAGDPKSEDFFNYEIHAILPMLTDSDTDANGLGHMADDKWQSTVDTLKCGGVENPPAPDTLFTNDYLPATEG
jgi:NitT/TauT family transport system substrate-binding protein